MQKPKNSSKIMLAFVNVEFPTKDNDDLDNTHVYTLHS